MIICPAKGKTVDANQEMLALGLCNIFGSFSRSMPTTGSFTRTAVNNASGVKTPMGGLITGCLVLLACGLLTSTFEFIPKATLAAVIIVAMYYMLELRVFLVLWRTKSNLSVHDSHFPPNRGIIERSPRRDRLDTPGGDFVELLGNWSGIRDDRRDRGKSNSPALFRGQAWVIDRGACCRWADDPVCIAETITELSSRRIPPRTRYVLVSIIFV